MNAVAELWDAHARVLALVAATALLGWVLLRIVGGVLVWVRARRHARAGSGCTGCGNLSVDVVAYPSRTTPAPYCTPCLNAWPEDRPQPPPMVGLYRPVDGVGLAEQVIAGFMAVLAAGLLIVWTIWS